MIPFWEEDLCKLRFTVESLVLHGNHSQIRDVFLVWASSQPSSLFQDEIDQLASIASEAYAVHLVDASPQVQDGGVGGWWAQQVLKLKVASLVKSNFYLVLDAKNTFIQQIPMDQFMDLCEVVFRGGEHTFSEMSEFHQRWYKASAQHLGVQPPHPSDFVYGSITPFLMHSASVLNMLELIGENASLDRLCDGPLCDWLKHQCTEFSLYTTYMRTNSICVHPGTQFIFNNSADGLWRGINYQIGDNNIVQLVQDVFAGNRDTRIFGAQRGSLDETPDDVKINTSSLMMRIYGNAGISLGTDSIETFFNCVVGTKDASKGLSMGGCSPGCPHDPRDWPAKCMWEACDSCPTCDNLSESLPMEGCTELCVHYPQDWAAKCTWKDCHGCPTCGNLSSGQY
jgi:hypothetical protein